MKTLKVALYVGQLPAPTFVNRLAAGLAKSGVEVSMHGKFKKRVIPPKAVRIRGFQDGWQEGRIGKFKLFLKYTFLLTIFQSQKKKRVDHWMKENGYKHWGTKAHVYPLLWEQPDIIHVQWAKDIPIFAWCGLVDIGLVLSLRGAQINYSPICNPKLAARYNSVFPKVNAFHGVSNAICHEAAKYGADLSRCHVVYSGFDLTQFPPIARIERKEKNKPFQLLSIGRSHWKKGYHIALDALHELKRQGVSFCYTIIGGADSEELLFQIHQLGLADSVVVLGNVPFSAVKTHLSAADAFLLPSVEEGIANVVLEAMLLGTPVISTNCGGMEEVVVHGETGWIVPIRNVQATAATIKEVMQETPEVRNRILLAARKKVEQQHSEQNMVQGMMQVYRDVMRGSLRV
ncbi:MAG: glycosyltransferase family 4 protein [Schleiferiaceae bacterium]|nr:glycosyltransferase family 4 protein [Schleiferiaceae bacterium]